MTTEERFVGLHVLVAEDNNVNAFVITQFLNKWGITVDVAENGVIAVELFSQKNYDIIFMDLNMPIMDGIEASQMILALKPSSKILALTAMAKDETTLLIEGKGFLGFVTKPFSPEMLSIAIHSVLDAN